MRIERTKNATRNIAVGMVLKIYQLLVPFIIRTVMIHMLGMEYLGLNSLFTSILQVLNLAELGVGSAMVFSMYKPIAEDDRTTINDLMKLYQVYYRIIGMIILAVGVMLTPFIPKLIKSDVPQELNIYILYYLNLAATVLSYWLFAYKNCLLTAHQRNDVISKVTIATNTVMYLGQILVLVLLKNYYAYLIIALVGQILLNIYTAKASDKMFPEYRPSKSFNKELAKGINQRIRDLFTSKVGEIIVNSADSIVISAFLGLTILASYNSYFYVLSAILSFVTLFLQACTAGIGNSLITETIEKNYKDLKKMTLMVVWIAGFCSCCLMCLYQPFMKLWIGENNILSLGCVACFVIYFFFRCLNQLFVMYKDAAGMWHEDRFRPLTTALANLALNLILVQFVGIYGVLLSTVISTLVIGMPWLLHNLFSVIFHMNMNEFVKNLLFYITITILSVTITFGICQFTPSSGIWTLAIRLLICVCIPNCLCWIAFCHTREFQDAIIMMDKICKGKIKFLNILKKKYFKW